VLRYFDAAATDTADVDTLIAHLASEQPPASRARQAARLHHVTLPKLDHAGVIDYDPRTATARFADSRLGDAALAHLEAIPPPVEESLEKE
jgi:hypothetical protein